jgi:hypothetical protein
VVGFVFVYCGIVLIKGEMAEIEAKLVEGESVGGGEWVAGGYLFRFKKGYKVQGNHILAFDWEA